MMNNSLLNVDFSEIEIWRMILSFVLGILVGIIYFKSLKWSVMKLGKSKHAIKIFALTAILRIAVFFGVLVLIANHNIVVILIYVLAFFFTKTAVMYHEKRIKFSDGENK